MKFPLMAEGAVVFLLPHSVSDCEHEIPSIADRAVVFPLPRDVSYFEHEIPLNG